VPTIFEVTLGWYFSLLTSFFSYTTGFFGVIFSPASAFGSTADCVFVVGADVEGYGPLGPID
jgi:hypothetical protein